MRAELIKKYGYPPSYDSREMYDMAKLTAGERDELLIRLDQKVQDSLPRIETHLDKINGHLDDHSKRITITETLQKERNRPSKKAIASWVSGAAAIIVALWKSFMGG